MLGEWEKNKREKRNFKKKSKRLKFAKINSEKKLEIGKLWPIWHGKIFIKFEKNWNLKIKNNSLFKYTKKHLKSSEILVQTYLFQCLKF